MGREIHGREVCITPGGGDGGTEGLLQISHFTPNHLNQIRGLKHEAALSPTLRLRIAGVEP